ncbi:phosphoribosylaminoimidazolesuccinocarboxamide synthase [Bernardetia sp.]|uniref:phosphoribosylaminoimidazolesuccinocarboxamide synthase n=1 Tax=Bernardetia sp. TaxID=1937974 RepID=UPI0025BA775F|nr:phosphoribosylaminoimidazolesuccinocarboxamide synthase [Bernardetia sp.]
MASKSTVKDSKKKQLLKFEGQTDFYQGKVRDVYSFPNFVAMVASDRISAFDVVLPKPIPYKGQVLNQLAAYFLKNAKDIVPNWFEESPHPQVSIGKKAKTLPVEMVIRGYLAGHAWRTYKEGKRVLCGVELPEGMKENDKFPTPIITPSTKAENGAHDEDISEKEILKQGLVTEEQWKQMVEYTHLLFRRGTALAAERGLILVDTKYEFGVYQDEAGNEQVILIDEIHTPDSSRYFYAKEYQEKQEKGERQNQLSKEFVREWLMENGFQGKEGQEIPKMTKEVIERISQRYCHLYFLLTGKELEKNPILMNEEKIAESIKSVISNQ